MDFASFGHIAWPIILEKIAFYSCISNVTARLLREIGGILLRITPSDHAVCFNSLCDRAVWC